MCCAVSDELWAMFVDHIHNVPGRVGSSTIISWARMLCDDMRELWQRRVEAGEADPAAPPKLPQLDYVFVLRWRRAYGVTWRTVNLRYKLSAAKRKARLRVFWCNVLRLRFLHERLFGPGKLRFVGFDQKPLYFNSPAAQKTLATAGARRVAVKENLAASRERFTVMTSVPSWCPRESGLGWTSRYGDKAPMIAVLFKSPTASAHRIRAKLTPPADCMLQFAEKGSYRLSNLIGFLDWFLKSDQSGVAVAPAAGAAAADAGGGAPAAGAVAAAAAGVAGDSDGGVEKPAAGVAAASDESVAAGAARGSDESIAAGAAHGSGVAPHDWQMPLQPDGSNTVVVVLDWYAPHLDGAVDNLLHESYASIMRIGGGVTGDVQVGDTHRHGPYTAAYREIETEENNRQLYLRPWKMPECSRQTVLDRAVNAWSTCSHMQCSREWKQDGILNALDGSEDLMLTEDLRPLWRELQMNELRDQIKQDIDSEVSNGSLTSWWQYPDVLESYDNHRPLREGEEMAEVVIGGDGPDDDDDGDDKDDGGTEDEFPSHAAPPSHVATCSEKSGASCSGAKSAGGASSSGAKSSGGASCSGANSSGGAKSSGPDSSGGASCCVISDEARQSAESNLLEEASTEKMEALSKAADILRKAGDAAMAQALEDRLLNLQRKKLQSSESDRVFLRSKMLERQKARSAAQVAEAHDAKRLRLLQEEAKIQKVKADQEKGKARVEVRKLEEAARVAARAAKTTADQAKANLNLCRQHWVAHTLQQWIAFFEDAALGSQRRDAVAKALSARKRKVHCPVSPDPWPASKRDGYISIAPPTTMSEKHHASKEIASESLAFLLYGGKHPSAATTCESVVSRAEKLAHRCMPRYHELFVGFSGVAQMLAKHKGNLDLALFEAMWRYSHVAGATLQLALHSWPPKNAELEAFASQCSVKCAPAFKQPPVASSSSSGHPLGKTAKHVKGATSDWSGKTWT